jgi:ComF family protein
MDKMVYQIIKGFEWIAGAWLPSTCIACANRGSRTLDLCTACRNDLPLNRCFCPRCAIPITIDDALCGSCLRAPPRYQASYCAFEYKYPVAEFVRAFKYGHRLAHARILGSLLADYVKANHRDEWPRCIVPVPLSSQRFHDRGFNQAIELGRIMEAMLDIPLNTRLLERVRHTVEQAGLSRRERKKNLRNAFAVVSNVIPDHIAILDDVVTTGSTMNEIARTLKRAGVKDIEVWAVARAPLK